MTSDNKTNKNLSVYIHIPFCEKRCSYCAFFSSTLNEKWQDKYVDSLVKEIESQSQVYNDKIVKTIYLGGGTPSLLSINNIKKITDNLYKNFNCSLDEFTIEVNPHSSNNLEKYKDYGIDRISIGIQSFDDRILQKIGRLHDKEKAINTLKLAHYNYDKISGDIILGIENNQNIIDDCKIIMDYANHISSYMLKVENGTLLAKQIKDNLVTIATENETIEQYNKLYEFCKSNGYNRYEVSNFAKSGYESKHNLHYWDMSNYLGLGAGAYSYVDGKRFHNINDIEKYINGNNQIIDREYSINDELEEFIMLSLRTEKGLSYKKFYEFFNIDFEKKYNKKIEQILPYINKSSKGFAIKNEYMLVQNSIITMLI